MWRGFYFRAAAWPLLALAACGAERDAAAEAAPLAPERIFATPAGVALRWSPPAGEDWSGRWLEHLTSGSRESQRFALQRLQDLGAAAGPQIGAAIRAAGLESSGFGRIVNLMSALGASGARAEWPAVADVLRLHPTPVARTAAAEAAAHLREPALLPVLREALQREPEAGPRRAMLTALARIGGSEAAAELEGMVRAWLAGAGAGVAGAAGPADPGDAWNAMMVMDGPELLPALVRLDGALPPPLRVQALTARIELGDRGVASALREYLDAERYPSAKTRMLALTALAELGEWQDVVEAAADPSIEVRRAIARLLGRETEGRHGDDLLDAWLGDADRDLRQSALAALVARGQRHRLDPHLQKLRAFPHAEGSSEALLLLTRDELLDPRLPGVLAGCWAGARGEHRLDLLRAWTKAGGAEAGAHVAAAVADRSEDPEVRRVAAVLLANFDGCVAPLRAWYAEEPSAARAEDLVAGLGRRLDQPAARAALLTLAADDAAPDAARKVVLDALPRLFGAEALRILTDLRGRTARPDVHAYLSWLLVEWF